MNTCIKSLLLLITLCLSGQLSAQFLFKQLSYRIGNYPSNPEFISILGDTAYMIALNGQGEKIMAKSDGKTLGLFEAQLSIDGHKIIPNTLYATKTKIVFLGMEEVVNKSFFFQYDPATGVVIKIDLGSSSFYKFIQGSSSVERDNNQEIYFFATKLGVFELWKTDNSTAGAHLIHTLTKAPATSFYTSYTAFDEDIFYYVGLEANLGYEIFKVNMTAGISTLLKEINPAKNTVINESPDRLYVYDHRLYFTAYQSNQTGKEPWVSDGTPAGTKMIGDMYFGSLTSNTANFFGYKGKVIFNSTERLKDSALKGSEFYSYDPQAGSYSLLKETYPGTGNGATYSQMWVNEDDELLFSAVDSMNARPGIWKSDGTTAGTYEWIDASDYGTNYFNIFDIDFRHGMVVGQNPNLYWFSYDGTRKIKIEDPSIPMLGQIFNPIVQGNGKAYVVLNIPTAGNLLYLMDIPQPDLGPDTTICPGASALLTSQYDSTEMSFKWNDGSSKSSLIVTQMGSYWLDLYSVDGLNYFGRDSIYIGMEDINFTLGKDTAIKLPGVLSVHFKGKYMWNTGSTDSFIVVTKAGNYSLHFISEAGCVYDDTVTISDLTHLDEIKSRGPTLYPNPIRNGQILQIKVEDGQILGNIRVYGIEGKKILEVQAESGSNTLELPVLAPGNYYIELELRSGEKSIARLSILP